MKLNNSSLKRHLAAAVAAVTLTVTAATPAQALFGLPSIVLDPSNLAQNVLTAARTLAMINNQIRSLANEIEMLTRLDKHLLALGYNVAPRLKADLEQIKLLMQTAESIQFTVRDTEAAFAALFPADYTGSIPGADLLRDARSRWELSRKAWRDTMVVQAKLVETLPKDIAELDRLIAESQASEGQLQATQAGNQLVALNAKQQMQLQQLMAAQFRADAIEKARATQAQEQAREQFKRFLGSATAY